MGWQNLGVVVNTIYEEQEEGGYDISSSSPSSPPSPLHSTVEKWSLTKGRRTDVLIRVEGKCFYLHKDPLTSRSTYLRRELTAVSNLTPSPPLHITAATFTLVADFCYGSRIVVTPFNVAALRTAAELLEMTDTYAAAEDDDVESLVSITDNYFRRAIATNREYALVVFRSCLDLLPDAETTALLVSRCIEAWSLEVDEDGAFGCDSLTCFDDIKLIGVENFQLVLDSMNRRFRRHDLLYEIIDRYLKRNEGNLTEEEKTQICNFIDCEKISPQNLVSAVQNPAMPMRFIVRAMLIEQLNTRRSIFRRKVPATNKNTDPDPITLGAILQRDAAIREAVKLKETMDATTSRIRNLEKELTEMKKVLHESELKQRSIVLENGRSASFHYGVDIKKIIRGERGSISSTSIRFGVAKSLSSDIVDNSSDHLVHSKIPKSTAKSSSGNSSIRQKLMNRIKNAIGKGPSI